MAMPQTTEETGEGAQAAIASALRTLEAEASGIDALSTALRDGLRALAGLVGGLGHRHGWGTVLGNQTL